MDLVRTQLLHEFVGSENFQINRNSAIAGGFDPPHDDYVHKLWQWRRNCENYNKSSHAAYCERCDDVWKFSSEGGALWLNRTDWVENPERAGSDSVGAGPHLLTKLGDSGSVLTPYGKQGPIPESPPSWKDGKELKVPQFIDNKSTIPSLWEGFDRPNYIVPLAPRKHRAKIKEPNEYTSLEKNLMADTEATRALFRDLLGMTSGSTAGGRGSMSIPQDIMDAMAGDAAQESMAREQLIMEMRRREGSETGAQFVSLDLMEMEADDVDSFLKKARKKIIKRSKPTRKTCCAKIGGVLDQILGAGGGDVDSLELQGVRDRGKGDPIGDADEMAEAVKDEVDDKRRTKLDYEMKPGEENNTDVAGNAAGEGIDIDLVNFIAEEFAYHEHTDGCVFANPDHGKRDGYLGEAQKFIQRSNKRSGVLRDYYNLRDGQPIPVAEARADYERLAEQDKTIASLNAKERKLFESLSLLLQVIKPTTTQKEDVEMSECSKTAAALSSFMESTLNPYAAANSGGGKGAPDAGALANKGYINADGAKLRAGDDDAYPTELTPAKSGSKKVAGEPGKVSTRGVDRGDPIGEDEVRTEVRASNTASALGSFMEATNQYSVAREKLALRKKDAGDLDMTNRTDTRKNLGGPLEKATGKRGGLNVYDDGGKKARFDSGANPIGGAVPSEQSSKRMKK